MGDVLVSKEAVVPDIRVPSFAKQKRHQKFTPPHNSILKPRSVTSPQRLPVCLTIRLRNEAQRQLPIAHLGPFFPPGGADAFSSFETLGTHTKQPPDSRRRSGKPRLVSNGGCRS